MRSGVNSILKSRQSGFSFSIRAIFQARRQRVLAGAGFDFMPRRARDTSDGPGREKDYAIVPLHRRAKGDYLSAIRHRARC